MTYIWMTIIIFSLLAATLLFWPLRKRYYLFTSSIIGFSAIAVTFYWLWGSSAQLEAYETEQIKSKQVKTMMANFKDTSEIIEAMKNAIGKNPEKSKGWYLLGRLYRSEKNYPQAISAFQKAYTLEPQNFDYTFEYLQSLYVISEQEHTPLIDQLIQQLKEQQPDIQKMPPELLDFLGYDAYIHNHNETAIRYWEALLPYLTDNSKAHEAILLAIGKAQKKLVK